MALFENFPYTNLHELNLDWVIKEIEDLKEGQVLSVNGQTGVVILYQDNDILFPAVTDSHWSMVRSADGTTRGIMFGNDDKAYIVHGNTMEQIYSASNQPPYPVESVNGKTGDVTLFTDNNGVVSFPAITDPDIEGIIIGRTLNNTPVYIQLNDDGTLGFTAGVNSNEIYTTKHTENNIIPVEEADTTETGTTNKQWGIVREVNSGDIGLLFNLGETPEVYIRYRDAGLNWQNVKLLTNDDIPSSSGVVSFNGQTGAVTADATDLQMGNGDTRSIADAIDDIIDDEYQMDNSITYTERGNTATQNIPLGKYVIWKNNPYISIANISSGDTLSSSNLLPLNHGIVDNLLNTVNSQASQINTLNSNINEMNAYFANTEASISITSDDDFHNVSSLSLQKGLYLIIGKASFPNNTTGSRGLSLSLNNTADSAWFVNLSAATTGSTAMQVMRVHVFLSQGTINLLARQNSGGSQSVTARIFAIKLK